MVFITTVLFSQFGEKGILENAILLQRQGKFDQAVKMINEYVERNPYNPEAYMRRAMIFDAMGQQNLMLQDLETANYLNPFAHLLYSQEERNRMLIAKNFNYDWVLDDVNNDVSSFRKSPINNHYYSSLIDDTQQTKEDSILNLALEAIGNERYNDAQQFLNSVGENPIIRKVALDLKGIIQMNLGNINSAISLFSKAIDLDPSFAIAFHNRSLCYKILGNYKLAEEDLNRAISINNDYANFYFTKGLLSEKMNDESSAVENYKKAIDKNDKYSEAFINYSILLKKLGRYEESIFELNKAIKFDPSNIENYYLRGNINLIYGEYSDSIDDFKTYLRSESEDADAYFNMGLALILIGNKEEGCRAISKSQDLGFESSKEFVKYSCR